MSTKLKTIPLCQLRRSKVNVRKTERLADVEQLAASIHANGLLENLVVRPVGDSAQRDAIYEVVAGGRRLAALKLLSKRKKIDAEQRIPCLIIENDASLALEASLAENFARVPIHPADQCDAFAALHGQGRSAEDIAARFGITPRFVLQRLKLADVSPRLIAEYRAGAMTLEQLTAFTLCDDHVAQEGVWFERTHGEISAQAIRRLLTRTQVEGQDRRARFVGTRAYEEAGGIVARDLFDTEDEGYFSDSQLLDRLVAQKLDALAETVRGEGWQWVEVRPDAEAIDLRQFERIATIESPLSETEEEHLSTLCTRYDALVAALEEDDGDSSELDQISAEIEALEAKKESWAEDEKAHAGVIVTLGPDGQPRIVRGLAEPAAKVDTNGDADNPPPARRSRAGGYAEALVLDLSAHHTAALREQMSLQPDIALLTLLHTLVATLFYGNSRDSCLGIAAQATNLERFSKSIEGSKAGLAFQARHAAWKDRLPEEQLLWNWLERLDPIDRLALLAHCVAMTVNAVGRLARLQQTAMLAHATKLDMRDWWQPTRANFLDRLTKTEILAAVSEGVSQQASWRLAGFKKDRMAKEAEKLLAETRWLPIPLRSTAFDNAIAAQ